MMFIRIAEAAMTRMMDRLREIYRVMKGVQKAEMSVGGTHYDLYCMKRKKGGWKTISRQWAYLLLLSPKEQEHRAYDAEKQTFYRFAGKWLWSNVLLREWDRVIQSRQYTSHHGNGA